MFADVRVDALKELDQLRSDAARLQLALLPDQVLDQLQQQPEQYFQQRARDLVSPFGRNSLLPADQDLVGIGRHLAEKATQNDRVRWDAPSNTLQTEDEGKHWVWVHATLPSDTHALHAEAGLLPLLEQTQTFADQHQANVLLAGGAILAAEGRASGQQEARVMGMAGLSLTLLLLLVLIRSPRIVLITMPIAAGLLLGLAGCLLIFGHVHILTLIIGTSLLGVLIDLPLHWLAPARMQSDWQARADMQRLLPTFALSLFVTISGYLALWFTPLPVLRQTALFSAFALLGACLASALFLPEAFKRWKPRPSTAWVQGLNRIQRFSHALRHNWLCAALAVLLLFGGWWRSNWQDDIRHWVSVSPEWLAQMQQVSQLGGGMASSRFLLIEADSNDALLHRDRQLAAQLQQRVNDGQLQSFQSLSQWVQPLDRQQAIQKRLAELAGEPWQWSAMQALGLPSATIQASLLKLASLAPVGLAESLQTELASAWAGLYLGHVPMTRQAGGKPRVAALIRLNGLNDPAPLQSWLAKTEDVRLLDRSGRLNRLFLETRDTAILLKVISYAAAGLLLAWMFGWRRGLAVLAAPLAAALMTMATMGWLGVPITLFSAFGLLLVSAMGIDYAVHAQGAPHTPAARLAGMLLAALTSMISFALLSISSTPAVAGFGICVTIGIFYSLIFASWLLSLTGKQDE
ncbi:MAG: MMPL family transporter [Lautropia sp.]|nr:MMPL family transporter [Lautropia sp.]